MYDYLEKHLGNFKNLLFLDPLENSHYVNLNMNIAPYGLTEENGI